MAPAEAAKLATLADDIDLPYVRENLDRLLSKTREGVDRVTRIVHSLRGLARTDTPKRQQTNLPDLVDTSLEILRGRMKRQNTTVETTYDQDSSVPCVQTQISQVFLNFLMNAQQAIEAAGRDEGHITVSTVRLNDDMLIEIGDNGTGIDPEHVAKLFDPFFTTKDVGEGTGLGLSIADNIIRAHGGRIEVESQTGVGTRLPHFLAPCFLPGDRMTAASKHTLLVVDDEPDVCDSVHDLLRREFRVLKARSAAEGCKLMEDNEVHIIMTDQRMPLVTGVELLSKIRKGHPRSVRMLFTGYADLDSIIQAIIQGHIFHFLKKALAAGGVGKGGAQGGRQGIHDPLGSRMPREMLQHCRQKSSSCASSVTALGGRRQTPLRGLRV